MNAMPPCTGLHDLFDSILDSDHRKAQTLCAECPMLAACEARLTDARKRNAAKGLPAEYGPRGTWAGHLVGSPAGGIRNPLALAAEERMFTEAEARAAHAAHKAGDRTARTLVGERVYQRRQGRIQRAKKAAA